MAYRKKQDKTIVTMSGPTSVYEWALERLGPTESLVFYDTDRQVLILDQVEFGGSGLDPNSFHAGSGIEISSSADGSITITNALSRKLGVASGIATLGSAGTLLMSQVPKTLATKSELEGKADRTDLEVLATDTELESLRTILNNATQRLSILEAEAGGFSERSLSKVYITEDTWNDLTSNETDFSRLRSDCEYNLYNPDEDKGSSGGGSAGGSGTSVDISGETITVKGSVSGNILAVTGAISGNTLILTKSSSSSSGGGGASVVGESLSVTGSVSGNTLSVTGSMSGDTLIITNTTSSSGGSSSPGVSIVPTITGQVTGSTLTTVGSVDSGGVLTVTGKSESGLTTIGTLSAEGVLSISGSVGSDGNLTITI